MSGGDTAGADVNGNPAAFGRGAAIGLVLVGALAFVALLYLLANGTGGNPNDGGGHAGAKGLNGFAGLVALLDADGRETHLVRSDGRLAQPGLLVLTPPPDADGRELERIVSARRYVGSTMVILPKWYAAKNNGDKAKRGWVTLVGAGAPTWRGFYDDVSVDLPDPKKAAPVGWRANNIAGPLPDGKRVLSGEGKHLVPLIYASDGRVLAAYVADKGYYPDLNAFAEVAGDPGGEDDHLYPVIFVFEPDLLDNWGLSNAANGDLALRLMHAAQEGAVQPVWFDITLNGFGHTRSLIDLAFEPPFLAATICLLIAALCVGWRGFNRFGPPHAPSRAIAPGKTALVTNSAGLIRRAGRVHLVSAPYADAVRERLAAALGLRRRRSAQETEQAIDAVQDARGLAGPRFSEAAAQLRAATRPHEVARRAATLHSIERALT